MSVRRALSTKRLAAVLAVPLLLIVLALSLGGDAAKQNSRCAGTVRNSRIITTLKRSLKMVMMICAGHFSLQVNPYAESWPLATPFMIVSVQRLAPNQYGISR